ncbi:uncharacterized protein LOC143828274 isoform X1 [Paroedura picta]|uniref:uncharacterized protein LOC143828274 isoform X1 n=1 Tax=Paroedura picta TaxID=143630 RepID=UPI004055EFFA
MQLSTGRGRCPGPEMSDPKAFLAVLLATLLMALVTSGQHPCQQESMKILTRLIQEHLGNSSDAKLYTPEDFTEACYDKDLACFRLELRVIEKEEEEEQLRKNLSRLISRLDKLQPQENCTGPQPLCLPCECHPEVPVPSFLRKLRQMLQWSCRTQPVPCAAKQRRTC